MLNYKWMYSLNELVDLYVYKSKKYASKIRQHYTFLIDLAKAVHGGGDDSAGQISKEDIEPISDEKKAAMAKMLGRDYDRIMSE